MLRFLHFCMSYMSVYMLMCMLKSEWSYAPVKSLV